MSRYWARLWPYRHENGYLQLWHWHACHVSCVCAGVCRTEVCTCSGLIMTMWSTPPSQEDPPGEKKSNQFVLNVTWSGLHIVTHSWINKPHWCVQTCFLDPLRWCTFTGSVGPAGVWATENLPQLWQNSQKPVGLFVIAVVTQRTIMQLFFSSMASRWVKRWRSSDYSPHKKNETAPGHSQLVFVISPLVGEIRVWWRALMFIQTWIPNFP